MKKIFLLSLFSLLALFGARAEIANVDDTGDDIAYEAVTIDGIHYVLRNLDLLEDMPDLPASDLTASVTSTFDYSMGSEGDLIVPASVTYEENDYAVTAVGDGTFFEMQFDITSVCLPASIQSIGRNAFSMINTETEHTLIVPDAGYDAYKSTAPWSNFANIVKKTSTGISTAPLTVGTERIEVYDLNGRIVYRGAANHQPALTSGAYVVKRGAKTAKVMVS